MAKDIFIFENMVNDFMEQFKYADYNHTGNLSYT